MARYIGSVCRLCRREGGKLYLKGDRCYTAKCAVEKRAYAPGQHGPQGARRKVSDYGVQLREKQKARRIYGILERQFRRYFQDAARHSGVTGVALLQFLETRLDNVVYRMGFAPSRKEARQLVLHGHFTVNGRKAAVPSYGLKPGDEVAVSTASRRSPYFAELARTLASSRVPEWLQVEPDNLTGRVTTLPSRQQIDTPLQEQLIVEYYSR